MAGILNRERERCAAEFVAEVYICAYMQKQADGVKGLMRGCDAERGAEWAEGV
jgi:hypothetical protein